MKLLAPVLAVSALALASVAVLAQTAPPPADAQFVKMATVGNTFEIEESKLALAKATDQRLKDFAQKMVDDHMDAQKRLADAAGGTAPAMMLDPPHQAMLDNLKAMSGASFDKIYVADQVAAHAETVSLLSDYKAQGRAPALRSWTDAALPVVKEHQAMIVSM